MLDAVQELAEDLDNLSTRDLLRSALSYAGFHVKTRETHKSVR